MKSIGIDLAGKENNPTGLAKIQNKNVEAKTVYSNEEIITNCRKTEPDIITIDAPLSFSKDGGF